MRVHFCGVRGSTPATGHAFERYGGATSCLAIAHDAAPTPSLLLDVGTGAVAASALFGDAAFVGAIVLTHLHWDHTQGLPFFRAANRHGARTELFVPDQGDGQDAVELVERWLSPPSFPIGVDGLAGDWTFELVAPSTFEAAGFAVAAIEVPHRGGRTYGLRVTDGRSTIAYIPDHCPTDLGEGPEGLGAYHAAALSLARDADVLVHDASLTAAEVPARSRFGHAAADYAVGLGVAAGARSVVCFHHAPDRDDDALDKMWAALGAAPEVLFAREGQVLVL